MASETENSLPTLIDPDAEQDDDPETTIRGLIPWLETPKQCSCGSYCIATTGFVGSQAMHMDIWQCEECDNRYYRD